MKRGQPKASVGLLYRWSIVSSIMVLLALWGLPRAWAVPISQREAPPAPPAPAPADAPVPEVIPSVQPHPTSAAGPGQRVDSDAPPGQRRSSNSGAPAPNDHFGLGYKVGNGLGFLGADMIITPIPHLSLDFQVSLFSVKTPTHNANGFGLAPMFQIFPNEMGRSTPYFGFGLIYASASLQNAHASVNGIALNVGYEWKWESAQSGFGILLGGGAAVMGDATATDGTNTVNISGGAHFNLEFGLRFRCCI